MKKKIAFVLLAAGIAFGQAHTRPKLAIRSNKPNETDRGVARAVRHQLLMLPTYSLFDDLEYKVNEGTVTLLGAVTDSALKDQAGSAVKHIEGVRKVNNQIEVLPPSPFDREIRIRTARAIFGTDGLLKYSRSALPPLHIIVKNGHVTLKGVVDSEADKNLAGMAANSVPDVFSVTNLLRVSSQQGGGSKAKK